jgi:hypothetical protein
MKPLLWIIAGPAIVVASFFATLAGMDHFVGPAEPAKAPVSKQPASLAALTITPAQMKACEPARVGKLVWNAKPAGAEAVQIFVVANNRETLFVSTDPIGQSDTGPWLLPGITFILRSPGGADLARTSVGLENGSC